MPRRKPYSVLIAFAAAMLALVFLLQMILATNRQVMTNDEGYHLYAGFRYWQCGDFGVNPEHPPLAKMLAALPLRLTHVVNPAGPCPVADTEKAQATATQLRGFTKDQPKLTRRRQGL